jgi:biotin-dependent carboxylase-like uncharacterized protein
VKTLTVVAPGPLSTIQDLGRPGYGHLGIGTSGAADRVSLTLANRIVGNDDGAAGIEMTLGRLRVRADFDAVIALTGANCAFKIDGLPGRLNAPTQVQSGQQIRVSAPTSGLRTYLAISGGIATVPVLGSRSTDTLSGIGPEKLAAGTVLPIGEPAGSIQPENESPVSDGDPVLGVIPGPRHDWFTADAWKRLCRTTWMVTPDANRVGVRLAGPALERRFSMELPSEPMVTGAVQVPPNGQPIIFLADHPVTGGYPVIGVVAHADLHLAAQLRPGRSVRFRAVMQF